MPKNKDGYIPLRVMYLDINELEKIYYTGDKGLNGYRNIGLSGKARNVLFSKVMYTDVYNNGRYTMIKPESYNRKNIVYVNTLLEVLFSEKTSSREATVSRIARDIIGFIQFINRHKLSCEKDEKYAKDAYQAYTLYLSGRMKTQTQKLSTITAAEYQRGARLFLSKLHNLEETETEHWALYISNIKSEESATFDDGEDDIPSESFIIETLNIYYQMFSQLYDLLINNKTFPYKITLPHRSWWIFPLYNSIFNVKNSVVLDLKNGSIFNIEEALARTDYTNKTKAKKTYEKRIEVIIKEILEHNIYHKKSEIIMQLAQTAMDCFYMLFLGITGTNEAQALSLPWGDDDNYKHNKDTAKFRTIKYRGTNGGKIVEFQIRSGFIQDFNKFLELRCLRLNGNKSKLLFCRHATEQKFLSNKFIVGTTAAVISKKFSDRNITLDDMRYITAQI